MNYLILVNKSHLLDKDYVPSSLVEIEPRVLGLIDSNRKILIEKKTLENWFCLKNDAKQSGYDFDISSAYRSYDYQQQVLSYYIEKEGIEEALKKVALPGSSEHQTGLAFDYFFVRDNQFHYDMEENDPEYLWIKSNAHRYGFIIRYPKGKENITGYMYEPWHLRYVGEDAQSIHDQNLTLEEHLLIKTK